jgi:hypothetical protein
MRKTIYVNCGFCSGMMEVDVESGQVINKWSAAERAKSGEDKMTSALKKIEDAKKKRAGLFDQTKDELDSKRKKTEDVFQKEVEKIKKEGVKENPIRPFDLD